MVVAGTHPSIYIDLGLDEPGMTLQREYRESGYMVWRQAVNAIETGKHNPSLTLAFALADTFGQSIEDMFRPKG